ncbi:hypothetical protein D6D01_02367 [Aureobasidium pullulans]|uniref:Uncharacterized protein n=1 Tax=Aureobasidium pullulans TaxID=5580 RepID=A0A4S9LUA7_AURPU|nr:hypothetical protein D6D01_02367 [Aureobasidium pullulans]
MKKKGRLRHIWTLPNVQFNEMIPQVLCDVRDFVFRSRSAYTKATSDNNTKTVRQCCDRGFSRERAVFFPGVVALRSSGSCSFTWSPLAV